MVRHAWYVFHVPGTNSYVPIWTIGAILFVLLIIVVAAVAIPASLSSKRRDENQ